MSAGFIVAMVALLPSLPPAQVTAVVIVYRGLLEAGPVLIALTTFAAYEIWWRLPPQRARLGGIGFQRDLLLDRQPLVRTEDFRRLGGAGR